MSQNLMLDPTKRDYVVVDGSPVGSDRLQEAIYYALTIPQGQWLYGNPDQGSLLYKLENQKRTSSVDQEFAIYASEAVKRQVINTGQATSATITNLESTRTGTNNQITAVQAQTQLSDQLNFVGV